MTVIRAIVIGAMAVLLATVARAPRRPEGAARMYERDWCSLEPDYTTSVAWGDVNGDGALDLVVGNGSLSDRQPNRLYVADGSDFVLAWSSSEIDFTWGVALGDWDGDGDLDLAVANAGDFTDPGGERNRVYRNDDGAFVLAWSSAEQEKSSSVAWGDYDGDGDLDLAVGNLSWPLATSGSANQLYENRDGTLNLVWTSPERDWTTRIAWVDWDGDHDLDLAVGNTGKPGGADGGANRIYRNDGGTLSLAWSSAEKDWTMSLSWGDWDGDGDPDLAVGNGGDPLAAGGEVDRVYRNDGGVLVPAWSSPFENKTASVAWGDWDGDGDQDLAAGASGAVIGFDPEFNVIYRNEGGTLAPAWISPLAEKTTAVAWGASRNGSSFLELAVANDSQTDCVVRRYQTASTVYLPIVLN